jgi:hypothetical protein
MPPLFRLSSRSADCGVFQNQLKSVVVKVWETIRLRFLELFEFLEMKLLDHGSIPSGPSR